MTTIYFVRHAEPYFNNHDDMTRELSQKGLIDRELVTKYLDDKRVDAVLSSPFKRAVDTVNHFADKHSLIVETVNGFRERAVDSCWIEDFDFFTRQQWNDFDYKLSNGESLREVQRRNVSALHYTLEKYPNKTLAIGSHGTALSTLINHYQPAFGYSDFVRIKSLMPWIVRFSFDGTVCRSITSIDVFTNSETDIL